jgi:hypothetical protein
VELPSLTHLEYQAHSFLLHRHRVLDPVHQAGCHFLPESSVASVKCPLSDPEMTSVYVTGDKY